MNTIQALAGMLLLVAAAYLFSTNRRAVNWRTVLIGLAIQNGLFLLINYVPAVHHGVSAFGAGFARC